MSPPFGTWVPFVAHPVLSSVSGMGSSTSLMSTSWKKCCTRVGEGKSCEGTALGPSRSPQAPSGHEGRPAVRAARPRAGLGGRLSSHAPACMHACTRRLGRVVPHTHDARAWPSGRGGCRRGWQEGGGGDCRAAMFQHPMACQHVVGLPRPHPCPTSRPSPLPDAGPQRLDALGVSRMSPTGVPQACPAP